uniref:AcidPPc domain-containing protein n=2 Tax=Bursaphelenchus xylophilus TaxID=6326 RepID=A0A1I7SC96_BURXY
MNHDLDSNASTDSTAPNLDRKPRRLPILRVTFDVALLAIVYFVSKVVCETFGPVKFGFFCHDQRISFPYKESTVPLSMLIIYCVSIPLTFILAIEIILLGINPHERYSVYEYHRCRSARFLIRLAIFFGYYCAFELFILLITMYTKNSVGRLRPYFLSVCQPLYDVDECRIPGAYIANYTCTGGSRERINEARLSFFSGHSSLAFGTAVFTVLYLQHRLVGHIRSRIVVPLIQTLIISTALFVAFTRIFDFKHHWTDVSVGIAVGVFSMLLLCRFVAGFRYRAPREVEAELVALDLEAERKHGEKLNLNNSLRKPQQATSLASNRSFQWAEAYS